LAYWNYYTRFYHTSLTATNTASYASTGTSRTAPSGDGVLHCGQFPENGASPNGFMLKPFGRGDGGTMVLTILGWKRMRDVTPAATIDVSNSSGFVPLTHLWAWEQLYQITCTLSNTYSNSVGGPTYVLDTSDIFCSSITMNAGFGTLNIDYYFNGLPKTMYADTKSSEYLQLIWESGTATQANAMIQFV
jgi:hypothetical protein